MISYTTQDYIDCLYDTENHLFKNPNVQKCQIFKDDDCRLIIRVVLKFDSDTSCIHVFINEINHLAYLAVNVQRFPSSVIEIVKETGKCVYSKTLSKDS